MVNFSNRVKFLFVICFGFYSIDFFFRISPSIIVPQLMQQYKVNSLGLSGFATSFYIGYALFQIPMGYYLDKNNFCKLLIPCMIISGLGFLGFTWASNYYWGYLLRFLIGVSSAISFIAVLFIARIYFPKSFSILASLAISIGTLSGALTQVIGVWWLRYANWQVVFSLLSVLVFLLAGLLSTLFIRVNKVQDKTIFERFDCKIILSIIKNSIIIRNAIIGGLFYLPTSIFASLWGVEFLKQRYDFADETASSAILLLFFAWVVGAPLFGWLARDSKKPNYYMFFGAMLGFLTTVTMLYVNVSYTLVWLLIFLFGFASSAQAIVWCVFDLNCNAKQQGFAVAFTNTLIMIFAAVFHALVGYFLGWTSGSVVHEFNFLLGLAIIPAIFIVVACMSLMLKVAK